MSTDALHIHAFIASRIDYCNAVLHGVTATRSFGDFRQCFNHAATRLIIGIGQNDHSTPTSLWDTLHWLPVSQRIIFKIALMTYDCISGRSPAYFRYVSVPVVSVPSRSRLRSADNDDMIVPRTRTIRYGPRSFRVVAPQIWNTLPSHLKNINISREQFKSGLRTWLIVQAY